MVEWMLQNSLGQLWFGLCERHGWTPEVVADGTLDRLEARRVEWRGKRERGEVSLEELMPIESGLEERWKYWVAFEDILDELVAVVMNLFRKTKPGGGLCTVVLPTSLDDRSRDAQRTQRKRTALLSGVGRRRFSLAHLAVIPGRPVVHWWNPDFLRDYAAKPKLGDVAAVRVGLSTSDNTRFVRRPWEVPAGSIYTCLAQLPHSRPRAYSWVPFVQGAVSKAWLEPMHNVVRYKTSMLDLLHKYRASERFLLLLTRHFFRHDGRQLHRQGTPLPKHLRAHGLVSIPA